MVPPLPSADMYGFGSVLGGILLWRNFTRTDILMREAKVRFDNAAFDGLYKMLEGMLNDNVEERWYMSNIINALNEFKHKGFFD